MTRQDIAAGLRLSQGSRWNQTESDWATFLDLNPDGCRVAEKDGYVVGSVATADYQDRFSWLAMVLVDAEHRKFGIGTALLREGLNILSGTGCVKLDATAAGRRLYLQHGFQDEYEISRMTITAGSSEIPASLARPIEEADLPTIFARDREVFGADRHELLRALYLRAPESAWVAGSAYCFGRPGFRYRQIGPIVAESEAQARELVAGAMGTSTEAFVIDAPRSSGWLEWLGSRGFTEERAFVRMYRGENKHPGIPQCVFGIVGPEFG